jgi:ribonucleotide reductase alpha subunit
MNFGLPYFKVGPIPITMLEQTDELIKSFETNNEYNFKLNDWLRIDSYNNPNNFQLTDLIGPDLQNHVMKFFPDHKLFGWSISHLPAKKDIIDHALARGPYVDQSQSMNLFFDNPNFKNLYSAIVYGWKNGIKTGCYYLRSKPAVEAIKYSIEIKSNNQSSNECTMCSA